MTQLKYWNGTAWVELPIQGPKGDTGPAGPTGADGVGLPEVYVGPDAPTPRNNYLLWVDNDALNINPFVDGPANLLSGFWAEDPSWVERPTVSGSKVSTWRNAGGGAAVQATSANQPTWVSPIAALNNRAGIQFGTASQRLLQDVTDKAVAYWVVAIFRMDDITTGTIRPIMGIGNGTGGIGMAAGGAWYADSGAVLSSGLAATTAPHLIVAQMNGASGQIAVDGVIKASGAVGSASLTYLSMGCTNNAGGTLTGVWPGSIHFLGIYAVDPRTDPRWNSIIALAAACGVVFP